MRHKTPMIRSLFAVGTLAVASVPATEVKAYPIDCAIFLCLAGGWPTDPDCNAARAEFIRRITPMPVEPPLQLWRCPMGVVLGTSNLTPMQRLEAIREVSATPFPELPQEEQEPSVIVEVSFALESWANPGPASPSLPAPTLANVDLSSADFDVIRSIRVWDVRHYSYRIREREGPCTTRLDMSVGTYDENANFHWSDRAPGPRPDWLPLNKDRCPTYFRGVGVEWSDIFGNYDYELVRY
ncbi:hypothetical protein [Ruegeria sp. Alg231-54]|uniref:hypothetical protein n=1 Tax=Ruegeria sp. Alg231-54 TaxID=1922221 RepID=UPI00131EFB4A|nr:hypothetical protein [Ruegeria sp. Alg231-54]